MTLEERFWSKVHKTKACWLWTGSIFSTGYGCFSEKTSRPCLNVTAHSMAWRLTRGPLTKGLDICHHCDVRACVNPKHLFKGTRKDNMQDAKKKGRVPKGEAKWNSKLTYAVVRKIRASYIPFHPIYGARAMARRLQVSSSQISFVVNNKTWVMPS